MSERNCIKCGALFDGRFCKACKKAIAAAYYVANRELLMEKTNAWRKENPDAVRAIAKRGAPKMREQTKKWRFANPERLKELNKKYRDRIDPAVRKAKLDSWRAANPHARSLHEQNRRSKAVGKLSRGIREKLFEIQRGKCACCKLSLGPTYHLDHIMPLALGGKNVDANMQLLRSICNMKKHAKHPIDYMQEKGFLL